MTHLKSHLWGLSPQFASIIGSKVLLEVFSSCVVHGGGFLSPLTLFIECMVLSPIRCRATSSVSLGLCVWVSLGDVCSTHWSVFLLALIQFPSYYLVVLTPDCRFSLCIASRVTCLRFWYCTQNWLKPGASPLSRIMKLLYFLVLWSRKWLTQFPRWSLAEILPPWLK